MMDVHEIRILKLLEAIEHHETPSQRDLAKALGVSLGLVNAFVRRLAKKGYFKITHLPRNRIRYILTPKGVAEKSRLTYAYIRLSYQYYRDARHRIRTLFRNLLNQDIISVAFYGTGDLAEIAYLSLQETDLQFAGISDTRPNGHAFFGHTVKDIDALVFSNCDAVIITIDHADGGVHRQLTSAGLNPQKIKTL
jgi:DNA-binding MarR family transcriptional regulator